MMGNLEINGNVGASVKAEAGSVININVAPTETSEEMRKRAVHVLLKACDAADCKTELQKISQSLFGTSYFKDLTLEQLIKLQVIAEEILAVKNKPKSDDEVHAIFTKEMNEYDDFRQRTGIRASRLERAALTELMVDYPFNPKQIKLVWLQSILVYEKDRLLIKLPVFEPMAGALLTLLSGYELVVIAMQAVLTKPSIQQLFQHGLMFLVFIAILLSSARYLIAPSFIGKQIKIALEKALIAN